MARVVIVLTLIAIITAVLIGVTKRTPGVGPSAADARTTMQIAPVAGSAEVVGDSTKSPAEVVSAQEIAQGPIAGAVPSFGTVGIDHKRRASFTGTAAPGEAIVITHGDKIMGRAVADAKGNWSVDFRVPVVRQEMQMAVSTKRGNGTVVSGPQHALISPPESAGALPRIGLVAAEIVPPTASADQEAENVDQKDPKVGLIIDKASSSGARAVTMTGRADPGGLVRVSAGKVKLADASVAADGKWSAEVTNSSDAAVTSLEIELYDADGKVLDQTSVPVRLAGAGPVSAEGQGGPNITLIKVKRGDSLWRISKRVYGTGKKWKRILRANRSRISDPDLIFPGQQLQIP